MDFTDAQDIPHWLCGSQWFPSDTALHVTKNGSVDRHIILKLAEHINPSKHIHCNRRWCGVLTEYGGQFWSASGGGTEECTIL